MTRRPVRWRRLLTYVVIAYGGAWLICLPLWLGQGLRTPHAKAWIVAMMFTPALAGLVTVLVWPDGRRIVDVLGLRPAAFRRWWWTLLVGWLGPPLLVTIAVGLAIAAGQFTIDWGTWSMFRTTLPNAPLPMPLSTLIRTAGRQPVPVPEILLRAVFGRFGLPALPPGAVAHLKYPVVIDDSSFRAKTGFNHRYDEDQTIAAFRSVAG